MESSLAIFVMALTAASANVPFTYYNQEPKDPQYVALLREALMKVGVNPIGITLVTIQSKNELYRRAYKATYRNNQGQTCYIKFRINKLTGSEVPSMPVCDGVSIGEGAAVGFGIPGGSFSGGINIGVPGISVGIPKISVGLPSITGSLNYRPPGITGNIGSGSPTCTICG